MSLLWLWTALTFGGSGSEVQIRQLDDAQNVEVSALLTPTLRKRVPPGKLPFDKASQILWMSLVQSSGEPGPPILGRYRRDENRLVFRPRFGLTAKQAYRVYFRQSKKATIKIAYVAAAPANAVAPKVVQVYPTASTLPANHLRFVILFSQPMRGGKEIFEQIQIVDDKGNVIDAPWLFNELWDESGKMLVLYIHPGRIKWGVLLRKTLGPVLEPNRNYSLVIRSTIRAANGKRMGKEYRKPFRATAENRKRISLAKCKIASPNADSRQPVALTFGNIIDRNSLLRFLQVEDEDGNKVAGKMTIGNEEKTWRFTPKTAWNAQRYVIVIDPRMEDHAGNTPIRPFDLDLRAPKQEPQNLRLLFTPN